MSLLSTSLAVILYILLFALRWHQGGLNIEVNLFSDFRQNLDQKIATFLPSPQAELLSGIILGKQSLSAPHAKKDFVQLRLAMRDTSTIHMMVVSGQNLTMLASLFLSLSGLIKRKIAISISILAIIFYTLMTGAQIPVLRAVIMVTLAYFAELFGRKSDGIRILIIVGGLMLLINPKWISDLSFQLSFLATFGVVVLVPILEKKFQVLPEIIKKDLAITTAAQLMVIPIIAQNFHQFSLVSIPANILVGWTIPFIMILGTLMIIFETVHFAAVILSFITGAFLTYFIYIVQFFSQLPFAWEYVSEQFWIVWIGYYMLLAGIMLSLNYVQTKDNKGSERGFN